MKPIHIINCIEVPEGHEDEAIEIRNRYVNYFSQQSGFIGSTFYRSINSENKFNFINIVVWDSIESYQAVVEKADSDEMKVLGDGFPPPMKVNPGQYEIISDL